MPIFGAADGGGGGAAATWCTTGRGAGFGSAGGGGGFGGSTGFATIGGGSAASSISTRGSSCAGAAGSRRPTHAAKLACAVTATSAPASQRLGHGATSAASASLCTPPLRTRSTTPTTRSYATPLSALTTACASGAAACAAASIASSVASWPSRRSGAVGADHDRQRLRQRLARRGRRARQLDADAARLIERRRTMKMMRSTSMMSTSGVTLMPVMPSSS